MNKLILIVIGICIATSNAIAETINYKDYVNYTGIGIAKDIDLYEALKDYQSNKNSSYNYDELTLKFIKGSKVVTCDGYEEGSIVKPEEIIKVMTAQNLPYILILDNKRWCYSMRL